VPGAVADDQAQAAGDLEVGRQPPADRLTGVDVNADVLVRQELLHFLGELALPAQLLVPRLARAEEHGEGLLLVLCLRACRRVLRQPTGTLPGWAGRDQTRQGDAKR